MKRIVILGLLASSYAHTQGQSSIELTAEYRQSPDRLQSPQVRDFDPSISDPHLRTWVLERRLTLGGFQAKANGENRFGIEVSQIRALTTAHFRAAGPWYYSQDEFPCEGRSDRESFTTYDGSLFAAERAARAWESVLELGRGQLLSGLRSIEESQPERAIALGQGVFQSWLRKMEEIWRTRRLPAVREEEWKRYSDQATHCLKTQAKSPKVPARTRAQRMEHPTPEPRTEVLARLPAKLWGGSYTIRANLLVGGLNLNGRFLLDPARKATVLHPQFLRSQGVNLDIFGKNKTALIGEFSLGGFKAVLPQAEISTAPSRYLPPEYFGSCCDGILGSDVLADYAIEFQPLPTASVTLFKSLGFSRGHGAGAEWVEVSRDTAGSLMSSDCGVRWEFSKIEKPELAPKSEERVWGGCDARRSRVLTPNDLSLGTLTLDLANGRMWLSRGFLEAKSLSNRSGIRVAVSVKSMDDTTRVVRVKEVKPGSPGASLIAGGLKVGTEISSLDGIEVSEMDHWEIEQRLAGRFSSKLKLKIRVGRVLKDLELDLAKSSH